jgi:hypothetical protein
MDAIVNRLTDVGPEAALQAGKLGVRHRAAIPFSPLIRGFRRAMRMSTIVELACLLTSSFL